MFAMKKLKRQICSVEKYIMNVKKGCMYKQQHSSFSEQLANPVEKLFPCLVLL